MPLLLAEYGHELRADGVTPSGVTQPPDPALATSLLSVKAITTAALGLTL
jgi:hypothetical protein